METGAPQVQGLDSNDARLYAALKPGESGGRPRWVAWFLAALLVVGAALRLHQLASPLMWVDEAESSINALSILEFGYPADNYLGIPIYENTLVRSWPENPEYEFKDISYSHNGLALYHGWFPLYSIAAAFRLFSIQPDHPGSTRPQHDTAAIVRRTIVARLPAVLFGLISILAIYFAGARLISPRVGLTAAILVCFTSTAIAYGQQARYYSATVALTALCAWSIGRMRQNGRWLDFGVSGVLFVLLFHTHLLDCVILCLFATLYLFWPTRRYPYPSIFKLLVPIALLGAGTIPWVLATNFVHERSGIPRALSLMRLPQDLIFGSFLKSEYGLLLLLGLVMAAIGFFRRGVVRSQKGGWDLGDEGTAWVLLAIWNCVVYVMFMTTIPAVSFFIERLALLLFVPGTLLCSATLCALAEVLARRRPEASRVQTERVWMAVGISLFVISSHWLRPVSTLRGGFSANPQIQTAIDYLQRTPLRANSRIYASPNSHLTLTFYTGLPIQSIAPVRKSFLDSYPGDVYFFELTDLNPTRSARPDAVQLAAERANVKLTDAEARQLSDELGSIPVREQLSERYAQVGPAIKPLPNFATAILQQENVELQRRLAYNENTKSRFLFFRDLRVQDSQDWWTGFFYRFVDPQERRRHPNFEDRLRNAEVTVNPGSSWVVYHSPGN